MSFVFKPVESPNINSTPFYANKIWRITNNSAIDLSNPSENYINSDVSMSIFYGRKSSASYFYSQSEELTTNNEYSTNIWNSVNNLFYSGFYDSPLSKYPQGEVGVETRNITENVVVLSIPQKIIGLGIQPGTFELSSSRYYLFDDGNGNIIGGDIDLLNSSSFSESNKNFYYCSYNYNELQAFNSYISQSDQLAESTTLRTGTSVTTKIYNQGTIGAIPLFGPTENGINSPCTTPKRLPAYINNLLIGSNGPDSPYYLSFASDGLDSKYIRIPNNEKLNFKHNQDFSIATWIKLPYWDSSTSLVGINHTNVYPITSTTGSAALVTKNGLRKVHRSRINPISQEIDTVYNTPGDNIQDEIYLNKYPYQIELFDPYLGGEGYGKIRFSRFDGNNYTIITSSMRIGIQNSADLYGSGWNLVVCRKSGSYIDISILNYSGSYIADATGSDICGQFVHNDSDIFIGTRGDFINSTIQTSSIGSGGSSRISTNTNYQYIHELGSVHFFDRFISNNEITEIYKTWASGSSPNQTTPYYDWGIHNNHYGNIYYKQGLVVLTDGRNKAGIGLTRSASIFSSQQFDFNYINFRSTKLIIENEVICNAGASEFNVTSNPSIIDNYGCNIGVGTGGEIINNNYALYDFATGSFFSPYITTIGLYNDNGDLLVVGKLSTPLKKNTNIDTIFIVRWDK